MNEKEQTQERPQLELILGDALELLGTLPRGAFDAVITDPPYSSGGGKRSKGKGAAGYMRAVEKADEFDDGTRDPFTHLLWTERWLKACRPLLRDAGWLMVFTDWRQLPMLATAVQMSGYVWQGIITWDKVHGRPFCGRFQQRAEYVIVASAGRLPNYLDMAGSPSPANVYAEKLTEAEKYHATAKPVGLMRHLMGVLSAGSNILDPFAGGGTTLEAARQLGHRCTGFEITPNNYAKAAARLGL